MNSRAVVHVLAGFAEAGTGLWGKERLVQALMRAQRAGGDLDPRLVVFAPHALADAMCAEGFAVTVLASHPSPLGLATLPALRQSLAAADAYVHTHGYKANVLGRAVRAGGARMRGLVATCHGWIEDTPALRVYNELDRRSAFLSDVTTVPDRAMLARFRGRARTAFVANGLPDVTPPDARARAEARRKLGFGTDETVVACVGRTSVAKGALDVLEAAKRSAPFIWAVAGTGDLDERLARDAPANLRLLGYLADATELLAAADIYVQASHAEGLSLALLEAMRAAKPIVASDVGATSSAIRDEREGRLVTAGNPGALLEAVKDAARDRDRANGWGRAARARFLDAYTIERQERDFFALYRSCERAP